MIAGRGRLAQPRSGTGADTPRGDRQVQAGAHRNEDDQADGGEQGQFVGVDEGLAALNQSGSLKA
ncbi:hypothetical protein ACQEVF_33150 [Nonomuraea polychroma]|uniref:hypothetical protein n=1 Tax=Nonomuraea polychroma TaxID=46176 RepID=UPI003D8EE056